MTYITAYCWGGPSHGKFVTINSGYYKVPISSRSPVAVQKTSIRLRWGWFKRMVAKATGIWKDVKDWEWANAFVPAEEYTYQTTEWRGRGQVFWTLSERGREPTKTEAEMLMRTYPEYVTRDDRSPTYREDERR